jgi:hypothetical protein
LPNQPYVPCCYRNDDCTARVGRGGEKSTAADQPIANTGTEPRENVMGTMMGCCGGRQGCHRRRQSQRNRHCNLFMSKLPSLRMFATPAGTSLVKERVGDLVAELPHLSSFLPWRETGDDSVAFLIDIGAVRAKRRRRVHGRTWRGRPMYIPVLELHHQPIPAEDAWERHT